MDIQFTRQGSRQSNGSSVCKLQSGFTRGHHSHFSLLLAIATLTFWLQPAADASEANPADSTNVLFIAIDDLNDWVGFLDGHLQAVTPHMDALAQRGCNFTNAHCDVPVCSPSRVSVMSGISATTHGSYELGPKYEQLPALTNIPTMQRYFKNNGYYTLSGGKVLHHGFGGRLSSDIDRSLGRMRNPAPPNLLNRPEHWSRAWDWGKYPETDKKMGDYQLARRQPKPYRKILTSPSSCQLASSGPTYHCTRHPSGLTFMTKNHCCFPITQSQTLRIFQKIFWVSTTMPQPLPMPKSSNTLSNAV